MSQAEIRQRSPFFHHENPRHSCSGPHSCTERWFTRQTLCSLFFFFHFRIWNLAHLWNITINQSTTRCRFTFCSAVCRQWVLRWSRPQAEWILSFQFWLRWKLNQKDISIPGIHFLQNATNGGMDITFDLRVPNCEINVRSPPDKIGHVDYNTIYELNFECTTYGHEGRYWMELKRMLTSNADHILTAHWLSGIKK